MRFLRKLTLVILALAWSAVFSKQDSNPVAEAALQLADSANALASGANLFGMTSTTPPPTPVPEAPVFTKLTRTGVDVGCGSEGDTCVTGLDGNLYCYDFYRDEWVHIRVNEEITHITRVDVDDDGRIYIIADCGIFMLDCDDQWVRLPGYGLDIGVGANFDVWKIGRDRYGDNYGVWKLFCECDCNCICTRKCLRFRKLCFQLCTNIIKKRCHWFRAEIRGINVDTFPNGDAAVVDSNGKVYIVDAQTFEHRELEVLNTIYAIDITVGNDGIIYITSDNLSIFKYNADTKIWVLISEATEGALRICASAYNLPWYIARTDFVYTSARPSYLPCIDDPRPCDSY